MIKYFNTRRKTKIKEVYSDILAEALLKKKIKAKEEMQGKDMYVLDMDQIQTTNDLKQALTIISNNMVFIMTPEEVAKTDKYLKKKK